MLNPVALIYKNLAKVTGVASAAPQADYPASNLLTTDKAETWRVAGTSAFLSGSSASPLRASCLYMLGNFSPTATFRAVFHSDQAGTVIARDTDIVYACPAPEAEIDGWAPAVAASAYAHGGGAHAMLWFPETEYRHWQLQISDPDNRQGRIEGAFLVLGAHWSPTYDVEGGIELTLHDTAVKLRSAAGSLRARKGIRYRTMPFDLTALTNTDRKAALRMFRYIGTTGAILVVMYPGHDDAELVRDTTIYGMLDEVAALVLEGPDSYATSIPIQEL